MAAVEPSQRHLPCATRATATRTSSTPRVSPLAVPLSVAGASRAA